MDSLKSALSEGVVNKAGQKVSWESITGSGKVIGIYFSAHWCPPCRGFTPQLAEWYNKLKASAEGKDFEIIFVSSDKDQASFAEYYGSMPWLALSFSCRKEKDQLSSKFGVRGIPTLIILNGETGQVITDKGREKVTSDPDGFPWQA